MKAVYFYSKKQERNSGSITKNGITYTEIVTNLFDADPTPEHNNFEDSIVVKVENNLPIDMFFYERFNSPHAKTLMDFSKLTFNKKTRNTIDYDQARD